MSILRFEMPSFAPAKMTKIRKPLLKNKYHSGLTLIELLVVISIIVLLIALMVPSLGKVKTLSKRLRCASNLKQIYLGFELYTYSNDHAYPCAPDPQPSGVWLWMGRGFRDYVKIYIDDTIDANNPSVLRCPSDLTDPQKYQSTSYAYSMSFYYASEQIKTITSVAQQYGPTDLKPHIQTTTSVTHPAEKILLGEWASHHEPIEKECGWWGWDGARNFLFADGHTDFIDANDINKANDNNPNPNVTKNGINGRDI